MKTFKGTKGEWILQEMKNEFRIHNGLHTICRTSPTYIINDKNILTKKTEEEQYNAKLIAAAPDLLEALQEAKKELEFHDWNNTSTYFLIVKAINKALD